MTNPLTSRLEPRSFGEVARLVLDTPTYKWIRAGAGSDFGSDNEAALGWRGLRPSVLVDVSSVTTAASVLGASLAAPAIIGTVGLQRTLHPRRRAGDGRPARPRPAA